MSGPLILFVGGIYAWIALDLWWADKGGLALAFVGYSLANFGLFYEAIR